MVNNETLLSSCKTLSRTKVYMQQCNESFNAIAAYSRLLRSECNAAIGSGWKMISQNSPDFRSFFAFHKITLRPHNSLSNILNEPTKHKQIFSRTEYRQKRTNEHYLRYAIN